MREQEILFPTCSNCTFPTTDGLCFKCNQTAITVIPEGSCKEWKMRDVGYYWWGLTRDAMFNLPAYYTGGTGRRYVNNVNMVIPGDIWRQKFFMTIAQFGYPSEKSTKFQQLERNYLNPEAVALAREKLEQRVKAKMDITSVAIPLTGAKKDARSQGFCMQSLVVTHHGVGTGSPQMFIDIFYRITEVTKKFGADLIFLDKTVIPALIPENLMPLVKEVRFRFSNVYFSPLFMPVLYPYSTPMALLREIWEKWGESKDRADHSMLNSCARAIVLPAVENDPSHYKFRMRRNMHQISLDAMIDSEKDAIISFCKEHNILPKYVGRVD